MPGRSIGRSMPSAPAPPRCARRRRSYDRLTDDERLGLLDGDTPFWAGLRSMIDARGTTGARTCTARSPGSASPARGSSTDRGAAWPGTARRSRCSMARGATWDVELEEQIGEAIGREIRAQGGNFFGGVCINLPRHPAWGRAQETYGDDPFALGELGAALARGTERYVMACVKHYALNSMENARFTVDVQVDEATLHDVYLPHFRRAIDEGVSAVMASYNSVNGEWAGQNRYLLTEVLRDQWGWDGITATDFIWGMRDGAAALEAGMDLEEPFAQQRATHLRAQLDAGETSWAAVERSGVRILATAAALLRRRDDGRRPAPRRHGLRRAPRPRPGGGGPVDGAAAERAGRRRAGAAARGRRGARSP